MKRVFYYKYTLSYRIWINNDPDNFDFFIIDKLVNGKYEEIYRSPRHSTFIDSISSDEEVQNFMLLQ